VLGGRSEGLEKGALQATPYWRRLSNESSLVILVHILRTENSKGKNKALDVTFWIVFAFPAFLLSFVCFAQLASGMLPGSLFPRLALILHSCVPFFFSQVVPSFLPFFFFLFLRSFFSPIFFFLSLTPMSYSNYRLHLAVSAFRGTPTVRPTL
jgi:hypothetical protein